MTASSFGADGNGSAHEHAIECDRFARIDRRKLDRLVARTHTTATAVICEQMRVEVNEWVRNSGEFDAVLDFDAVVRDPARPTQLLPKYASEDLIHANDAGNEAQAAAIALEIFD